MNDDKNRHLRWSATPFANEEDRDEYAREMAGALIRVGDTDIRALSMLFDRSAPWWLEETDIRECRERLCAAFIEAVRDIVERHSRTEENDG